MTAYQDVSEDWSQALTLPATWENLSKVNLPLAGVAGKAFKQLALQMLLFVPITLVFGIIAEVTFREFMHGAKMITPEVELRATVWIALMVGSFWLLSRLTLKTRLNRLKALFHLILPVYVVILGVFAGG